MGCGPAAGLVDCVVGVGEGHAVGEHALALLELLHGGLGVDSEAAVRVAAREAEDVEPLLQLSHVVAVQVGKAQVECAVSHLVAGVNELGPRGGVNLCAKGHAVVDPELCDRRRGGRAERPGVSLLGAYLVAERPEALLNVFDRGARCALANRVHVPLQVSQSM